MKKLWSLSASAALVGGGLFVMAPPASSADPYPGSVPTTCQGHALNNPRVGHRAKVEFDVDTGGNGAANGQVSFTYERRSSGVAVVQYDRRYEGPTPQEYSFTTGKKLPKGKYVVRVFFNSKPVGSVYQNCHTHFKQTIRPRKHR